MKKINTAKIKQNIKSFIDLFPLRLGALLFLLLFIFTYSYLSKNYSASEISSQAMFLAVAKFLLWFIVLVVLVSLLCLIIAYIVFYIRAKRVKNYLNISLNFDDENEKRTSSLAHIKITKMLFPIFGAVKVRFNFENNFSTKKYILSSKKIKFLMSKNYESYIPLDFGEVKNYVLKSATFYFEDYFALFAIPYKYAAQTQFFILPTKTETEKMPVMPMTERETTVRTNIVRYIPGEYLRFKNFEPSDDVRRIVWKVYAKSKDIVVRTQELRNPYASLVTDYVSFVCNMNLLLGDDFKNLFSSYYKNAVWGVYSSMKSNKDISLKLQLDQQINFSDNDELPKEIFEISAADWQNSTTLNEFYNVSNTSMLCFSSLVSIDDLREVLGRANKSTIFVFVKLSSALNSNATKTIIKNLFFKPQAHSADSMKLKFLFSPLRKRMLANEKQILEILKNESNNFYEI